MKKHIILLVVLLCSFIGHSQDLEPRFLSSMPTGTNFTGVVYGYSSGDILLNSLIVEDLNAKLNSIGVAYGRSFKLFNKPSKFDVVVPYSFGELNALVEKKDSTVYKSGFGDPSFRISMILIGEKPLPIQEFASREINKFKLGAAFKVRFPLGTYDPTKMINFGANRWGFQLKVAGQYIITKKLIAEIHIDSWFFTENTSFYNGNTLQQTPLLSTQLNLAYVFNPKLWVAASAGQVAYGETELNGEPQDDDQKNSKYSITGSYKVSKKGSLKLSFTDGLLTYAQTDFNTILVGYSFVWFDKKK